VRDTASDSTGVGDAVAAFEAAVLGAAESDSPQCGHFTKQPRALRSCALGDGLGVLIGAFSSGTKLDIFYLCHAKSFNAAGAFDVPLVIISALISCGCSY
jgi:hypothetical protein